MTRDEIEAVFANYGIDIQQYPFWAIIDAIVREESA